MIQISFESAMVVLSVCVGWTLAAIFACLFAVKLIEHVSRDRITEINRRIDELENGE